MSCNNANLCCMFTVINLTLELETICETFNEAITLTCSSFELVFL